MQPFPLLTIIGAEELPSYECSDRILLPKGIFEAHSYAVNDLLAVTNTRQQSVFGTLFGIHSLNSSIIYAPSWMTLELDLLDKISISHIPKRQCTAIQIKPHSETFAKNDNYMGLLNQAIINYRSLTQNTRIPLLINGSIEYVTIEQMLPSSFKTFFVFGCGSVKIQTLPSYESEKKVANFLYDPRKSIVQPIAFIGKGDLCGGELNSEITPQQAAAAAARDRMKKHQHLWVTH